MNPTPPAPVYPVPPPAAPVTSAQANQWAMFCHLAGLARFVLPLGGVVGPLIVWLVKRNEIPAVDAHGKESLNFQISFTIYSLVLSAILFVAFAGALHNPLSLLNPLKLLSAALPLILAGLLMTGFIVAMVIVASLKANKGESFHYPLAIPFLR